MRSWLLIIILGGMLAAISMGCSHGGNTSPAAPPVDITPQERSFDMAGHYFWGVYEATINYETLEIEWAQKKDVEFHFDILQFILPPFNPNGLKLHILTYDPVQNLISLRIEISNPTGVTAYDTRGIFYLKPGQEFLDYDNYTDLFDLPGDYDRNPFVAFSKDTSNRVFAAHTTFIATYRLILPPDAGSIAFTFETSFPGNCEEPYEMEIYKPIDFLADTASYSEKIQVIVKDWQNDIAFVQLDLGALGATSPVSLTKVGDFWEATVSNSYGAGVGFYDCWLQAGSSTGPMIYEPVEIEIKAFAQDRLEAALATMYKWNNGNPGAALTKSTMKYEGTDLNYFAPDTNYGDTRLPYYDAIHREPLKTVPYCMNLLDNLEIQTDPPNLNNILTIGSQQLGETFAPAGFSYIPTSSPIADAMESLYSAAGSSLSQSDKSTIASQTAGLPLTLQYMTAAILKSVADGYLYRQTSLSQYSSQDLDYIFEGGTNWFYNTATIYYAVLNAMDGFDYPNMYKAASPVLQAIDGMRDLGLYYVPQPSAAWSWDTPIGMVKIGSSLDDTHSADEYLLLLDPGGNDTYNCQAGGNASLQNGFSICIDLAGNDIYQDQGDWNYSQGAGRCGVGILWDVFGNDTYDNYRYTQGFANFGVGVLLDSGGNDTYNVDGCGQGSGYHGLGFMIDEWGDDQYDCYSFSQGFGFVKGWGLAYDGQGNDRWTANDTNIIYPSAQTADHNMSMSQGQGFGIRYDGVDYPNDTIWKSGGQGILFDKDGDDEYSCGVFGGGCAYWYGTGILADYGGNDTCYGIWYVYGASAHYGTAFFINKGFGNDSYTATTGVGVGGGHDFSNTFFLEEGGDDTYTTTAHSLGAGNECGTGVFVDYGGNDNYLTTHEQSIGNGNWSDGRTRGSWGVFLDLGGTDSYMPGKAAQGCGDNSTWNINDIGAGGDSATGVVTWQ
ncbi:MAG: hypothetical protein NTY09_09140 [bacterium]|nr:hypothetical protein [bacterium]